MRQGKKGRFCIGLPWASMMLPAMAAHLTKEAQMAPLLQAQPPHNISAMREAHKGVDKGFPIAASRSLCAL